VVLRVEMTFGSNRKEVVSTGQLWVLQQNVWRIAIVQARDAEPMAALRLPERRSQHPSLFRNQAKRRDLDAAFRAAKEDHKRVLVVFGGELVLRLPRLDRRCGPRGCAAGGGNIMWFT